VPDPLDAPGRIGATQEVDVDLSAFLPEGSSVAGDVAPETSDASGATFDAGDGTDTEERAVPSASMAPAEPMSNKVDVAALTRIEGELAGVDAALSALDAGDVSRSVLLGQLLAHHRPPLS
jgi:hypothetical protein